MERLQSLLPEDLTGHKAEYLENIVQSSHDLPEISQRSASAYVRNLVACTSLKGIRGAGEREPRVPRGCRTVGQ